MISKYEIKCAHVHQPPTSLPDRGSLGSRALVLEKTQGYRGRQPKAPGGICRRKLLRMLLRLQMRRDGGAESLGRRGPPSLSGTQYLLRPLLLLHAVTDHHVDRFPAEPLHDPLEAALLPCTCKKGKETALAEHPGLWGLLTVTQVLAGSSCPPRAAHGAVRPQAACVRSPSAREGRQHREVSGLLRVTQKREHRGLKWVPESTRLAGVGAPDPLHSGGCQAT